ncbi:hypothetical protein Zm00014a_033916 [Zea mays]|uniref:Uncharacterized protein n=1 Tax=Zea mays TaxID=4577 RepID=A0A3L6GAP3_MAIZE|nr:hypothetical protein Zm00014a_033916 [Zea mays]
MAVAIHSVEQLLQLWQPIPPWVLVGVVAAGHDEHRATDEVLRCHEHDARAWRPAPAPSARTIGSATASDWLPRSRSTMETPAGHTEHHHYPFPSVFSLSNISHAMALA